MHASAPKQLTDTVLGKLVDTLVNAEICFRAVRRERKHRDRVGQGTRVISFLPPPCTYIPHTAILQDMFGDDGLERLNKTLRQQLSDRGELSSPT